MSNAQPLLIELGTEELPIGAVDTLARALLENLHEGLRARYIGFDRAASLFYCTPRRLVAYIPAVASRQPDVDSKALGPAVSIGLDAAGQPTAALRGFAAKIGVAVESLTREMTDKGERYVYASEAIGQPLAVLLPEILAEAIKALPIARPMRWGDHAWSFVRPLHWLVILHGDQVIEAELFGIRSTRHSRGHRFMADKPVWITDADAWVEALRGAKVIADPGERRERIRGEVARVAAQLGGMPQMDDALLDQIANLTEWPVAIGCSFDRYFLSVPEEALIATMVANQKFVPLLENYTPDLATIGLNADPSEVQGQRLSNLFIGVANIESSDPAQIRHGYERVIRPRFADAMFFWNQDLRELPLSERQGALKTVIYQPALGSLWDKSVRVAELSRVIANRVGVDAALATRAAELSRCDLLTRMVGEFPELQGVMGRTYASHGDAPEAPEVAAALDEVYMPRQAGDGIARSPLGRVLAVAERFDTLAGLFAISGKPGGAKDPYALRRAALGLARTLIEGGLLLDTRGQLLEALEAIPEAALAAGLKAAKVATALDAGARRAALAEEIERFIVERLRGYYAEQGIAAGVFEAVLAVAPSSLVDFDRRLRALAAFTQTPECAALVAANKRVGNILRKQAEAGEAPAAAIDEKLLAAPSERTLALVLQIARDRIGRAVSNHDYREALAIPSRVDLFQMVPEFFERFEAGSPQSSLIGQMGSFFEQVMVVHNDPAIRANRLALLAEFQRVFNSIADLARL